MCASDKEEGAGDCDRRPLRNSPRRLISRRLQQADYDGSQKRKYDPCRDQTELLCHELLLPFQGALIMAQYVAGGRVIRFRDAANSKGCSFTLLIYQAISAPS